MKKNLTILGVMAIVSLISCNNNEKREENQTTPPAPVTQQPTPVTQQTTPAPEKKESPTPVEQKDGTTIKVNGNGVSLESKNAQNKNNVNISKDSLSIELSKPK